MKPIAKIVSFLLATAFMMLACQVPSVLTPTGTSESGSSGNENLQVASPASLSPTNTPEPYTFVSDENGIHVRYPQGWSTQLPESGSQSLVLFVSPDSSVQAYLYVFPADASQSLESAAADLKQSALEGLEGIQTTSDSSVSIGGVDAWTTITTGVVPSNGTEIKINLTTAIYGSRLFFMMTYGTTEAYDYYASDITALTSAMQFQAPIIAGVSRDQGLFLAGGESTNPREYDPATTLSSGDKLVYSGLVSLDTDLRLVPELAESWEISSDGTAYTFHIRANAKFHDGRSVTAQDVVYSWERAADPATGSDTVLTYLGDILGVAEMHSGQARTISGLKVVDEHTLQVTIDAAKPYFPYKLTMPVAFVLDRANVESGSEWYRTPNGTGPYKLTRWISFQDMVYQRNESYYLGAPSIPYVVVELYSGFGLQLYQNDEIDVTGISTFDVPAALDPANPLHPDLHSGVSLCTSYVAFDITQPPFDDAKVRQAFTMAIDRQKYVDVVMNGIGIPAKGLYPPALPGYNLELKGLPYDPVQARELLAESRYGGPQGLPDILYTDSGIGNSAGASVAALAQMWQQNLGITITIENLDPNNYGDLLYQGIHGQLFDGGWCADYPDPENFADALFHTGAEQNTGKYSNPELDAILDQARTERDVTERIALYQQAEQILVQDAAALFTVHYISYVLVKPYVKGYVLTPIDIPLERYLQLDR